MARRALGRGDGGARRSDGTLRSHGARLRAGAPATRAPRAEPRLKIGEFRKAEMLRWMLVFWVGTVLRSAALRHVLD